MPILRRDCRSVVPTPQRRRTAPATVALLPRLSSDLVAGSLPFPVPQTQSTLRLVPGLSEAAQAAVDTDPDRDGASQIVRVSGLSPERVIDRSSTVSRALVIVTRRS